MPTPVSALLHAATMVTAGIYLLIRSQAFFIIQPNLLITMTIIGSLTAFFAASTGLTQNDIKKIIAYSTCSQLGYMFLACGLGQFSISFFHLINHAFFVRQHRYLNLFAFLAFRLIKYATNSYTLLELRGWELNDGPSLRNLLKRNKSTYLFFKFKYNLKWERLMKMNSRQNCIIMIGIFYSFEKFIPGIINEGLHITSRCRIEKISPPFLESYSLSLKIIQILKVGKPVKMFLISVTLLLIQPFFLAINFQANLKRIVLNTIQSGCRIGYQANELLNRNYRLFLINSKECRINHSSYNKNINYIFKHFYSTQITNNSDNFNFNTEPHNKRSKSFVSKESKNLFKKECKNIFQINKSLNIILFELQKQIPRWIFLLGLSNKNINFIRFFIRQISWSWVLKKHKKVSKNKLYNMYFESSSGLNFSLLKSNKDIINFKNINLNKLHE
jgi:hypothetical protein